MRRLLTLNRNALAASILSVSMVAGVAVTAMGQEGYEETRLDLHEAGVWVTQTGLVGRLNTQIESMELSLTAGAMVSPDVAQDGDVVVAFDRSGTMVGLEPALHDTTEEVDIPAGAEVQLGGGTGVVADLVGGRVWLAPGTDLLSVDSLKQPPTWPSGENGADPVPADPATDSGNADGGAGGAGPAPDSASIAVATGLDGVVHVVEAGGKQVVSLALPGNGGPERLAPLRGAISKPQITAVGPVPVALDGETGLLHLPGRAPVDLSKHGDELRLQLPGPQTREVLVGAPGAVLGIDLSSGAVTERIDGGAAGPVSPVWALGCAYGAWSSEGNVPTAGRWCGDGRLSSLAVPFEDPDVAPGAEVRFRVNRERVVLNDPVSGVSLTIDHEVPKLVKDWPEPLNEEGDSGEVDPIDDPTDEVVCSADPPAAEATDAEAGTRAATPVIVPILDQVTADPCDVVAVSIGAEQVEGAEVGVVRNGTAIQVTPERGRTEPVVVPYTATSSGGAPASATLTVAVRSDNGKIETRSDETVVEAGKVVRHNVLANDVDPEGDPLTLVGVASVAEGQGPLQYQANGMVTYTAPGVATGPVSVTYAVVDDRGARADGVLEITVLAPGTPQAPRVTADRVSTVVGAEVSVNLLANDTDANGDPLQLARVHDAPPVLGSSSTAEGVLTLRPTAPGPHRLVYSVSDGSSEVQGSVLVEVGEQGTNRTPLAVRDDVAARPGVPAVLDLVANDVDPDGDLLAVTTVDVPPDAGLSVELLAMHKVRITTDASFTRSMVVPYRVSDGREWSTGRLVVRPLLMSEQNQEPIALPDVATVRAGSAVAVTVLRNDVDPEGELLTIRSVTETQPSQGRMFVQGDELRFVAAATGAGDVTASYVVEDPEGNTSEAEVTIRVLDAARSNQAPSAPPAEARVFAGGTVTIPLPLLTMDADGDVVSIVGVEPSAVPLGRAEPVGGGIEYTAGSLDQGVDTFTYTAQDPAGRKATGRVRVAVVRPPDTNSAPVAVPDRIWATAGMTRVIPVLANDVDADGDELAILDGSVTSVSSGRGTVEADPDNAGYLIYTAPDDVADDDPGASFGYEVDDGRGGTARGVVTISLVPDPPANKPPLARDDFAPAQLPDREVTVDVLANDVDPDNPDPRDPDRRLVVTTDDPRATVRPDGSLVVSVGDEPVTLLYQVHDGGGPDGSDQRSAWAIVSVPVVAEFPPVAVADEIEVVAGAAATLNVLKNDRNPTGAKSELRVAAVGSVPGLVAEVVDDKAGTVKVTASDQARTTQFTYTIANAQDDEATGVVTVRVTRPDGADDPLADQLRLAATTVEMKAGDERTIDLARLATPAGRYRYTITQPPTGGVTARTGGAAGATLTIAAPAGSGGTNTTVGVSVQDGSATPVEGKITVRVAPESGAGSVERPVAVDDAADTPQGRAVTVSVLRNDRGEGLQVTSATVTGAGVGAATHDGTAVTFTPDASFAGTALLTYRVQAGDDPTATASANIRVRVAGRPGAPGVPTVDLDGSMATLTWSGSPPNGATITGYLVESDQGGFRQDTGGTSLRVDLLKVAGPGVVVRFRVAALTDGDNPNPVWSGWTTPVTAKQTPSAPWSVRAAFDPDDNGPDKAGGVLHVAWSAPEYGASPDRYIVTASPADVGPVSVTGTTAKVTGLTNGVSYQFTVVAESDQHGRSLASGPSAPAVPIGVPGLVQELTAVRAGVDGVMVSWSPSQVTGGDTGALRYRVSADPATAGSVETSDTSVTLNGLGGGDVRNLTVSVVAINTAGAGPAARAELELLGGTPGPPIATFSPGVFSADFQWTVPNPNGTGEVTVEMQEVGDPQWFPADRSFMVVPVRMQFQFRACKYELAQNPCSEPALATNRHTGADWVVGFNSGTPRSSVDGDTVTWAWDVPDQEAVDHWSITGSYVQGEDFPCDAQCVAVTTGTTQSDGQVCIDVTVTGQGVTVGIAERVCAQLVGEPAAAITGHFWGPMPECNDLGLCPSRELYLEYEGFVAGYYDVSCDGVYLYPVYMSGSDSVYVCNASQGYNGYSVSVELVGPSGTFQYSTPM